MSSEEYWRSASSEIASHAGTPPSLSHMIPHGTLSTIFRANHTSANELRRKSASGSAHPTPHAGLPSPNSGPLTDDSDEKTRPQMRSKKKNPCILKKISQITVLPRSLQKCKKKVATFVATSQIHSTSTTSTPRQATTQRQPGFHSQRR
jgi:hypothetical protein